jgi:flagellar protein FliS
MSSNRLLSTYRRTEVQSRTPLELVVMLYDGGLASVHQARAAVERGDVAARALAVSKAMAIVSQLQSTLNMEAGGDIARQLDDLYTWMNGRLLAATTENSAAPLDEVARVLAMLRESWTSIAAAGAEQPVRGAA